MVKKYIDVAIITLATVLILSGIAVAVLTIAGLSRTFSIGIGRGILLEESSQFGAFIGGISGSVWALAGVLLYYLALRNQGKEIANQQVTIRQQSNMQERLLLTSIVAKQIEQYNAALGGLELRSIVTGEVSTGRRAFIYLEDIMDELRSAVDSYSQDKSDENSLRLKKAMRPFHGIVKDRLNDLSAYVNQIFDSCFLIIKMELALERDDLKSINGIGLYFDSIGADKVNQLYKLKSTIDLYRRSENWNKVNPGKTKLIDNLITMIDSIWEFSNVSEDT